METNKIPTPAIPPVHKDNKHRTAMEEGENAYPDYPVYAPEDDIYNKAKEEQNLDPEDITELKDRNTKRGKRNEKDFTEDNSGDDLDVPGAELDDKQEDIGSEDEENNYYSLGGDNHNNLEEDIEE